MATTRRAYPRGSAGETAPPGSLQEFFEQFTRETNRLRMAARARLVSAERELERSQKEGAKLVQAVVDGLPAAAVKALGARKTERRSSLEETLHPIMADIERRQVTNLASALSSGDTRIEAFETSVG